MTPKPRRPSSRKRSSLPAGSSSGDYSRHLPGEQPGRLQGPATQRYREVLQPDFLNTAAVGQTELPPADLLAVLKTCEQLLGRRRSVRWGPRPLDLDLLLYGDLVRHDKKWDIPRREITEYAFVLKPLSELAPARLHPELKVSYSHLWESGDFSDQDLWEVNI